MAILTITPAEEGALRPITITHASVEDADDYWHEGWHEEEIEDEAMDEAMDEASWSVPLARVRADLLAGDGARQKSPTFPFTDAISFAGS